MTKEDHIQYWVEISDDDWVRSESCFKNRDYVFGLFGLHLSLEKLLKALWVKENKTNFPPRIHNLRILLENSSLVLSEDQLSFLNQLNTFQIEGRYPDYQRKVYRAATPTLVEEFILKSKTLKKCILEKLV